MEVLYLNLSEILVALCIMHNSCKNYQERLGEHNKSFCLLLNFISCEHLLPYSTNPVGDSNPWPKLLRLRQLTLKVNTDHSFTADCGALSKVMKFQDILPGEPGQIKLTQGLLKPSLPRGLPVLLVNKHDLEQSCQSAIQGKNTALSKINTQAIK